MKYLSIDIETTGLDHEKHQILSIGIIIEDTTKKLPFEELPKFHCAILHNEIIGEPYALAMNKELLQLLSDYQERNLRVEREKFAACAGMDFLRPQEVCNAIWNFLVDNDFVENNSSHIGASSITVAGKNFGTFDKLFLEKLPNWGDYFKIRNRILDPSILFIDWDKDYVLPSLDLCKQRANIKGNVTHKAIDDAWDVVQLFRTQY